MNRNVKILSPPSAVDHVFFDMTHTVQTAPLAEHSHDCIEIGISLGGSVLHYRGEVRERLKRGDVFLILPGGTHRMEECESYEHINVSCSPDALARIGPHLHFLHGARELFQNPARSASFHLSYGEFHDVRRLLDSMFELYREEQTEWKGDLRAGFTMLLCLLAQSSSLHHDRDSTAGRLDATLAYLHEHYREALTLSQLASHASLSVSQLVRLFRKKFNATPMEYVLDLRLEEARRLLRDSELSVSEIAFRAGFNDANYFSRMFRQKHGYPPSGLRQ